MQVVDLPAHVVRLVDAPELPERTRETRDLYRVPDVDWTGHQYKAAVTCRVNYSHVGRDVAHGREVMRREKPNASIM